VINKCRSNYFSIRRETYNGSSFPRHLSPVVHVAFVRKDHLLNIVWCVLTTVGHLYYYDRQKHWHVTGWKAIAQSCNIFIYRHGWPSLPSDNNNNTNNNSRTIPRQVISLRCCHHRTAIARVHPVHLMNV